MLLKWFLLFCIIILIVPSFSSLCSNLPASYQKKRRKFDWQCVTDDRIFSWYQQPMMSACVSAKATAPSSSSRNNYTHTRPSVLLPLLWCLWWFEPTKQYQFMFIRWKILYIAFLFSFIYLFLSFVILTYTPLPALSLSLHPSIFSPVYLYLHLFTNNDEFYHTCTIAMANYIVCVCVFPFSYLIWSWCDVFLYIVCLVSWFYKQHNKMPTRTYYPVQICDCICRKMHIGKILFISLETNKICKGSD